MFAKSGARAADAAAVAEEDQTTWPPRRRSSGGRGGELFDKNVKLLFRAGNFARRSLARERRRRGNITRTCTGATERASNRGGTYKRVCARVGRRDQLYSERGHKPRMYGICICIGAAAWAVFSAETTMYI